MKKILLITSVIIGLSMIGNMIKAQTPNWTWAKQVSDTSIEYAGGIASDTLGNVYAVGYFRGTSVNIGTNTLTNAGPGSFDSFIVKYDAGGNILWTKEIGSTGDDFAVNTATDKSGNFFVAGSFSSPSLVLGSYTLTNTGGTDLFLVKYDTGGNVLWARSANGTGTEDIWALCVDGSGNAYIGGRYEDSLVVIGSYSLTHIGTNNTSDILVAKYDGNGNVLWAKGGGGDGVSTAFGFGIANGISVDGSGNVYVSSFAFCSTFTVGTIVLIPSTPGMLALLIKFDASGNPLWIKDTGGIGDFAAGVTSDATGNAYIIGNTNRSPFTIGTTTVTTAGGADLFIVKFDAAGNPVWAKCAGGSSMEQVNSISSDTGGNIYITGGFQSPSVSFGSTTLTRVGNEDIFSAKYDASGNALWATSAYGNNAEGRSICIDPGGDVYVTGWYKDTAATFGSTILSNAGNYDVFVAKLSGSVSGIKENSLNNSAFIYPNPFTAIATIKLDENIDNAIIRIYNTNGQIVKEINNFNGSNYVLSRENLEAGMYFLQIVSKEKIIAPVKITIN